MDFRPLICFTAGNDCYWVFQSDYKTSFLFTLRVNHHHVSTFTTFVSTVSNRRFAS